MENEAQQIHIHSFTPKHFHRAVRNYLTNELGITKEHIEQITRDAAIQTAERLVENQICDSDFFRNTINAHIGLMIKNGVNKHSYYSPAETFDRYIQRITEEAVKEKVLSSYDVSIKVNQGEKHED